MSALLIQLFLLVFILAVFVYSLLLLYEFYRVSRGDVPFVPSTTAVINEVIAQGVLPREGMILDLGCGDGKALRLFARAGHRGPLVGYERSPLPWFYAKLFTRLQRLPVDIRRQDFAHASLEEAKGVYLFLLKEVLAELGPVLKSRLAPGTPVVSAEFDIPGWAPERVFTAPGITSKQAKIFLYRA